MWDVRMARSAALDERGFLFLHMRSAIRSPLFEIALVFVRLNHVAIVIVNTNHSIAGSFHQLTDLRGRIVHDRLAVTDPEYLGLTKIRELLDGPKILIVIEREPWPAGRELGPRGDYVAGEQRAPIGPPERQASGRVPRRWDHLEWADAIARFQRAIHLARRVPAEPERQPQLKPVDFQRLARDRAHPSRLASARDYVHFPSMRAHSGGARFLQRSEAAKVRLVSMREDDVLQVRGRPAYSRNLGKHHLAVVVIQRINERQAVAVVEEVGMNVSAFLLRHAVNAWTNLHVRFLVGRDASGFKCRCPGLLRLRAGSLCPYPRLDFPSRDGMHSLRPRGPGRSLDSAASAPTASIR